MPLSVACLSPHQNVPYFPNVVHAVEFIRKMRGGSQPALIRCDDGKLYVVKFFNNLQGPSVLANEVLGNELLRTFDLPTPQWKAIFLSNNFVKEKAGMYFETHSGNSSIESGLHFGSEFLGGVKTGQVYEWLPSGFRNRITNPDDFLGIHVFDVWANHCDHRQSLFTTDDGNASFRAVFVDNGHLFGGPDWKLTSRPGESLSLDTGFHPSEWPEDAVEKWIVRLETKISSSLCDIISNVPRYWYSDDINSVVESLVQRMSILRPLLAAEKTRRRIIFKLSHMDLTDAKLSLHRSELPFYRDVKEGPTSRFAS
jgi:hypothetical protein